MAGVLAYDSSYMVANRATYRPPTKFKAVTIEHNSSSPLSSIISEENLKTKQVWHITATDNSSLLKAREQSTNQPINGSSALYGDSNLEFKILKNSQACPSYVMAPASSGSRYKACAHTLRGKLEIQQVVEIPSPERSPGDLQGGMKVYAKAKSLPRQPNGLRERHKPLGALVSNPWSSADGVAGTQSDMSSLETEFRTVWDYSDPRRKGSPCSTDLENARNSPTSSLERKRKRGTT